MIAHATGRHPGLARELIDIIARKFATPPFSMLPVQPSDASI